VRDVLVRDLRRCWVRDALRHVAAGLPHAGGARPPTAARKLLRHPWARRDGSAGAKVRRMIRSAGRPLSAGGLGLMIDLVRADVLEGQRALRIATLIHASNPHHITTSMNAFCARFGRSYRRSEGGFEMRVTRRVAARAAFDEHTLDALAGDVRQLVLVDEGHLGVLRLRRIREDAAERQGGDKRRTENALMERSPSVGGCRIRLLPVSGGAIRRDRCGRGALRPTARVSAPRPGRPSIGPRDHTRPHAGRPPPSDSGRLFR
jgi:hypothetical protein